MKAFIFACVLLLTACGGKLDRNSPLGDVIGSDDPMVIGGSNIGGDAGTGIDPIDVDPQIPLPPVASCAFQLSSVEDVEALDAKQDASSIHLSAANDTFFASWRPGSTRAVDGEYVRIGVWSTDGVLRSPIETTETKDAYALASDGTKFLLVGTDARDQNHVTWFDQTMDASNAFPTSVDHGFYPTSKGVVHATTAFIGGARADIHQLTANGLEPVVDSILWDEAPGGAAFNPYPVSFREDMTALAINVHHDADTFRVLKLLLKSANGVTQVELMRYDPATENGNGAGGVSVWPIALFPMTDGFVLQWADNRQDIGSGMHLTSISDEGAVRWERSLTAVEDLHALPDGGFIAATFGYRDRIQEVGMLLLDQEGMEQSYLPLHTLATNSEISLAVTPSGSAFGMMWADNTYAQPGFIRVAFGTCQTP